MDGFPNELAGFRAVAFDLDGTLYEDGRPIPGAVEVVRELREGGIALRFLTNTTTSCRAEVAESLTRLGFDVEAHEVHSPPYAAGVFLRSEHASAELFVQKGALADFEGVPTGSPPDWVVVGDLGPEWSFGRLNRAFQLVHAGAGLLGLGRTRYWQVEGELRLDAGPIIAALENATGTNARIFGKPDPAFFAAVVADLCCPADRVVLVGDDARTDVEAAMNVGLTGVLVKTGKFRPPDLESVLEPDLVLDSVADLLPR